MMEIVNECLRGNITLIVDLGPVLFDVLKQGHIVVPEIEAKMTVSMLLGLLLGLFGAAHCYFAPEIQIPGTALTHSLTHSLTN